MNTAVKICGITRVEDALTAARCGAHAIGLVFHRASPRFVEPDVAGAIVRALPPFVTPVGLFVDAAPDAIAAIAARTRVQLLQFHGSETPRFCAQFDLPFIKPCGSVPASICYNTRRFSGRPRAAARCVRGRRAWRYWNYFD